MVILFQATQYILIGPMKLMANIAATLFQLYAKLKVSQSLTRMDKVQKYGMLLRYLFPKLIQ